MALHAAVVGSGPNGLTAACRLARAGWQVTVYESAEAPGGAARSAEVFGPGLISDLGASVLPFASPAYEALLPADSLEYAQPPIPAGHPLENIPDSAPALLHRSLEQTAAELGPDGELWRWVIGPLVHNWDAVRQTFLSPRGLLEGIGSADRPADALRGAARRAASLLQIGAHGSMPARNLMRSFRTARARALFAGLAAHSTGPLSHPLTSAFGVLFAAAGHAGGWPVIRGGTQQLVNALVAELEAHGGQVVTDFTVAGLKEVPLPGLRQGVRKSLKRRGYRIDGLHHRSRGHRRRFGDEVADVVVLDLTPAQLLRLEGLRLTERARSRMAGWSYGPGVVKIDYLVDGPIPWEQPELARAGTVHLGGSAEQITASEAAANRGVLPGRPYVLLAQPSAADETRTPDHRTLCWAYAHVPFGLDASGTARAAKLIEAEISRFAPQFREAVLQRKVWGTAELETWNPNLVGGSLSGGLATPSQIFAGPAQLRRPYSVGPEGIYVCSAAAPPGGGAHGMPGFNAAAAVLRDSEAR
ncbi:phytoene desaturase family protein [Nesterenkonia alkaliphila]|uniref:NAD(P)-binding protein n=1 Tax=Nesterenkonia alkaliphila TaxID=1463631 RepID=A0A7K1UEV5_9MICC|nr:NAD(P)/FAD-dependent oxidoreductase [Nesterenkonia alkaliphila]MVT24979.1 NAD(P)-binding protein [Nesterenkonia alkaliphila]GFZ87051.1 phytoene dehydrogenase [Nesterenkonia alkaliphila]